MTAGKVKKNVRDSAKLLSADSSGALFAKDAAVAAENSSSEPARIGIATGPINGIAARPPKKTAPAKAFVALLPKTCATFFRRPGLGAMKLLVEFVFLVPDVPSL